MSEAETICPPPPPAYASLYPEEDRGEELKMLVLELQSRMQYNFEWMARQIQEVSRSNQYLVSENNLLRTRQEERQRLMHELQQQHRLAMASRTAAIESLLQTLLMQQQDVLKALSQFAISFDSVPGQPSSSSSSSCLPP
jgi:hypothetical protein